MAEVRGGVWATVAGVAVAILLVVFFMLSGGEEEKPAPGFLGQEVQRARPSGEMGDSGTAEIPSPAGRVTNPAQAAPTPDDGSRARREAAQRELAPRDREAVADELYGEIEPSEGEVAAMIEEFLNEEPTPEQWEQIRAEAELMPSQEQLDRLYAEAQKMAEEEPPPEEIERMRREAMEEPSPERLRELQEQMERDEQF